MIIRDQTTRNEMNDVLALKADLGAGTNPSLAFLTAADALLMEIALDPIRAILASAGDGIAVFDDPTEGGPWTAFSKNPALDGLLGKCLLRNKDDGEVCELSVGLSGSGAEVIVSTLNFTTDVPVEITVPPQFVLASGE